MDLLPQTSGSLYKDGPPIFSAKIKAALFGVKHTFEFRENNYQFEHDVGYYSPDDTYVSGKLPLGKLGDFEVRTYPISALPEGAEFDPLRKGKFLWTPARLKSKEKVNEGGEIFDINAKFQFTLDWEEWGEYAAVGLRGVFEFTGPYGFGGEWSAGFTLDMGVLPGESYCRNMCHFRLME